MKRVQLVGHTTVNANAFTGLVRELTVDYGAYELRLHDGATVGGNRFLNLAANDLRYQGLTTLLTAFAGLSATGGIVAKTGANTVAARTLTGTANQITVTNGDGASANPTLTLPSAITAPGSIASTTTITAATGFTVSAGGAAITGNSTITGTLGGLTGLTVASGGLTVTAGGITVTAGTTSLQAVTLNAQVTGGSNKFTGGDFPNPKATTQALGSVGGGTSTVDLTLGTVITATQTGNQTYTFSNPPSSAIQQGILLYITFTTLFTVTITNVAWDSTLGAPTLVANKKNLIWLQTVDGGTSYQGSFVGAF